jgi:psp operon transcriptional activator
VEIRYLKGALERTRFKQKAAAALLELTYDQFRGLYRKYKDDLRE